MPAAAQMRGERSRMRCAIIHSVPLTGETPGGTQLRGPGARGGLVVGVTKGFIYAAGGGPVAATANSSGSAGPFVAALNISLNARINPPELAMYLPLVGPAAYVQARPPHGALAARRRRPCGARAQRPSRAQRRRLCWQRRRLCWQRRRLCWQRQRMWRLRQRQRPCVAGET